MTDEQKIKINKMRQLGLSYQQMSVELNIPKSTIKTYCNRIGTSVCKNCGKPIRSMPKCKPRVFCSDKCRFEWWKHNKSAVSHKTNAQYICAVCGKEFTLHRTRPGKYCSRACYDIARGGTAHD